MSLRCWFLRSAALAGALALLVGGVVACAPPVAAAGAAPQHIEVNVSNDPQHRYGEPQIAVNPKNPKNLVYATMAIGTTYKCQQSKRPECEQSDSVYGPQPAGLMQDAPNFSQVRAYVSLNGGKTWRRTSVPTTPPDHPDLVESGDPLVAAGPDGTFYLGWDAIKFCLCATTIIDAGGIAVSTSKDGGRTWSKPVLSGTPVDRPFFAVDHSTGTIYEASTGLIGANSKGDPNLPESPIGAPGSDRWLVASSDGVHWSEPKPFGGFAGIGASGDAAEGTYATAFKASDPNVCGPTACTVFQTTSDQGASWTRHMLSIPSDAGSPMVAADPQAKGHFTVAVQNGARTQYLVYQTKDSGVTWTGPTAVAEDASATHFHSWLAYSPKGTVGLMWQTNVAGGARPTRTGLPAALPDEVLARLPEAVREAVEQHAEIPEDLLETLPEQVREAVEAQAAPASGYSVWASVSQDGGATFSTPLKVSKADSPPPQTGLPFGIADDFSNIVLSPTRAFVGWADYRPGDRSGYFSAIDLRAFTGP